MQWNEFKAHVSHLSAKDQKRVEMAYEMGKKAHGDQKRISGEPYFTHPIAVARMLCELHADADTLIAALLHDTIEDTNLSLREIEELFDGSVADLIDGLTKLYASDVKNSPTLDEKVETLRKIFTGMQQDVRLMVIKIVDRLHNMQTIEFFPKEKQRRYAQETLDTFVKIADRLCMFHIRMELEELCLAVLIPHKYKELKKLREQNQALGETLLPDIKKEILNKTEAEIVDIHFEHKTWQKLRTQLESGGDAVTGVSNVLLSIVCKEDDDCYQALGTLHQLWQREHLSFQDFINSPMINGYQGVHTTIILENGTRIRCKIRSEEMNTYSNQGIAALCFDSEARGLHGYLPWLKRILPLTEDTAEYSEHFYQSLQSDILGESIVVHAIDDQAILLPKGATVLDAVFYCYAEKAPWLKNAYIDGKETPVMTAIENGTSLSIDASKKKTVSREWLDWCNTGIARAAIRSQLSSRPRQQRIGEGKKLLQEVLLTNNKGYIEEFAEKKLLENLKAFGLSSLNSAYIAIAEGHMEPLEVFHILFQTSPSSHMQSELQKQTYTLRAKTNCTSLLVEAAKIFQRSKATIQNIKIKHTDQSDESIVQIVANVNEEHRSTIEAELSTVASIKIEQVKLSYLNLTLTTKLSLLVLLWSFDVLLAKRVVAYGISPVDITLLRFIILLLLSGAFLAYHLKSIQETLRLKWATSNKSALTLAAVSIFVTALCTYTAFLNITSSAYAAIITVSTLVVYIVVHRKIVLSGKAPWHSISTIAVLCTAIFVFRRETSITNIFALTGIGAGAGFACYSFASRKYLSKEAINTRYPLFVLYLACIAFLFSLPLLPLSTLNTLSLYEFGLLFGFLTVFTSLPYLLYFQLTRKGDLHIASRYIPLFFPVVLYSDALLRNTLGWWLIVPIVVCIWWVITAQSETK